MLLYIFFLSVYPFGPFSISVQSLLYTPISLIFTPSYLTTNPPVWYFMRGAHMGRGVGWGGAYWVAWKCSWLWAQTYVSAQLNVSTWFPNQGPTPAPCPAGDWGVDLRGLYLSTISQPQLWFNSLFRLTREKWFRPFLLPQFNSVAWLWTGITYIACHWKKEQTEKIFYCSRHCLTWLSFLKYRLIFVGIRIIINNFGINAWFRLSIP